eukprot:SAG11_NODE_16051_length_558_cov_0.991285_1_plen_68_part_10
MRSCLDNHFLHEYVAHTLHRDRQAAGRHREDGTKLENKLNGHAEACRRMIRQWFSSQQQSKDQFTIER